MVSPSVIALRLPPGIHASKKAADVTVLLTDSRCDCNSNKEPDGIPSTDVCDGKLLETIRCAQTSSRTCENVANLHVATAKNFGYKFDRYWA